MRSRATSVPLPSARVTRRALLGGALVATGAAVACTSGDDSSGGGGAGATDAAGAALTKAATTDEPVVAPGDPAASAAAVSAALFESAAAAVVLAPGATADVVDEAVAAAQQAGVPCLVDGPDLAAELDRLGTGRVRRVGGGETHSWTAAVTDRDETDELDEADRQAKAPLVIATTDPAAHAAAIATVVAALGDHPDTEVLTHDDPRADAVVRAVRGDDGRRLVVVGDHPGIPGDQLAAAATMAATAPELPGGGVLPFPGRRMVALYGHPGVAGLGLLGEQEVDAAVTRAEGLAEDYAEHSKERVVPAFEIIATVADSGAGPDGDYSSEATVEMLRPWVDAAAEAGVYVVLDLQPGRADFLSQAKRYEELLTEPHVGLALDPEWRLGPDEVPLQRIGHVEIEEVNEVATWLAELTRTHGLPQKVFTLHQFQLQMLRDRDQLRTDLPEVVTVIHADGHGTPGLKQETWTSVKKDLPEGTRLGWKNFIDEDTPTFTPEETMRDVEPAPWFVSYQ